MPAQPYRVVLGVPVFNEAAHLRECLESIQRQDLEDFRVIISDNGSTDESSSIALEFCSCDDRFTLIRSDANDGAAVNFGRCASFASAPYFAFVGAHDVLMSTYLSTHVRALEEHPEAVMSFTPWQYIDELGNVVGHVPEHVLPGLHPRNPCRWQRVVWSVRHHAVGSGLWNGVRRSCHMPHPPYPTVMGGDHLFLTKELFHGTAIQQDGYLYSERNFARRRTGYMERITGHKSSHPNVLPLYREYMRWYDGLPPSQEKTLFRPRFQRAAIRKCALMTGLWARINGMRARLGLGPPIR